LTCRVLSYGSSAVVSSLAFSGCPANTCSQAVSFVCRHLL
jgi:hypothetical protein